MAIKQIQPSELKLGEKVTLKLRDGESVIVGKVTEKPTAGGNIRIGLTNNQNSVVITDATNFRVFVDRGPTAAEKIDGFALGTVFSYLNKYGVRKQWVKTASDRYTRVDQNSDRPATSYSKAGFPSEDANVVTFIR